MSDPSDRIRGTTASIDNAAKQLRKTLTPAEQQLWQALRGGKLAGLKFRRQHPVGNFILDFYCAAHKLVVEVDGGIHETQIEYDAARTTELESYGYTIVRFMNEGSSFAPTRNGIGGNSPGGRNPFCSRC
jgi:very-short-patch-repair endonuclease